MNPFRLKLVLLFAGALICYMRLQIITCFCHFYGHLVPMRLHIKTCFVISGPLSIYQTAPAPDLSLSSVTLYRFQLSL